MYSYNIEDVSFAKVKRLVIRVRVDAPMSEEQLRMLSEEIVLEETRTREVAAAALFFYLPATNILDAGGKVLSPEQLERLVKMVVIITGKVDWAPEGDWEKAGQVRAGDYSKYRYKVKVGVVQLV